MSQVHAFVEVARKAKRQIVLGARKKLLSLIDETIGSGVDVHIECRSEEELAEASTTFATYNNGKTKLEGRLTIGVPTGNTPSDRLHVDWKDIDIPT